MRMETGIAFMPHASGLSFGFGKIGGEKWSVPLKFSFHRNSEFKKIGLLYRRSNVDLKGFSLCKKTEEVVSELQQTNKQTGDEDLALKREAEIVAPYLSGQGIYLVGMMGSGKTTVGKILSEALDYSFLDSDELVEHNVGVSSVAQIFDEHGEEFFRINETKALKQLSTEKRLVVATGGGIVTKPINWKYMKKGLSVWLDVPLDSLARRIAAVGTASRPLLHKEAAGDAYTLVFNELTALYEERGENYKNADVRVALENLATGKQDVNSLTPEAIAIEILTKIKDFLLTNQFV